jgi:hypothetical protein
METPHTSIYFAYALVQQASADAEPITQQFTHKEFCMARETYLQMHERDTSQPRKGHFTTGYFPNTQLYMLQLDAEKTEENRVKVLSNRHQPYPFGRIEPLAKLMIDTRKLGYEWFVENEDTQRQFFKTEGDCHAYIRKQPDAKKWQVYNLDKHLDHMEGQSIQYFLVQRSALSTNQLEVLADLGRGTLSKIKNGQRILSRKQYGRIARILQHYGYVAWVDLRMMEVA